MPLKILLRPNEKIIINQTVISNGQHKAELVIHNNASVLREKDIMNEDDANTPAKRVYFTVQLIYLFPENLEKNQNNFNILMRQFLEAVPSATPIAMQVGKHLLNAEYYLALKSCKQLIEYESEVMRYGKTGT